MLRSPGIRVAATAAAAIAPPPPPPPLPFADSLKTSAFSILHNLRVQVCAVPSERGLQHTALLPAACLKVRQVDDK